MNKLLAAFPLLLTITAAPAACSSAPPASAEHTAQVSASVTAVPTGVACIAIDAGVAEEPLVTERFTVAAGQSTTLNMTGLPSGAVTFSAFAYSTACASVTSTSIATWASEPVLATLASQLVTSINLVLRPAGSAAVGVTFSSCPQGEGSCDGTTCVTLATDPNNCGGCGTLCPSTHSATGAVLAQGTCVAGVCGLQCATGNQQCPTGCEDLATDIDNCGSCGNECITTHSATGAVLSQGVCVAGSCEQQCVAPTTQCPGGGCENLATDIDNCGSCGNECLPKTGATGKVTPATCVAGECQ